MTMKNIYFNAKNCDNCKNYEWYWDYCLKWKCTVHPKEIHSCYELKNEFDKNPKMFDNKDRIKKG